MRRWLTRLLWVSLLLGAVLIATLWWLLRGSLAHLDGALPVDGLQAPASISRDARGVVTIDAASQADAMRALGWCMRRNATSRWT